MALLILEAGDICEVQDNQDAGQLATKVVKLLHKSGTTWTAEPYVEDGDAATVEEKYLTLLRGRD